MGATTYLVPALTVLMSWAILGQVPGWLALAGGMLCLAGVALSRGRSGSRTSYRQSGFSARNRSACSFPAAARPRSLASHPARRRRACSSPSSAARRTSLMPCCLASQADSSSQ